MVDFYHYLEHKNSFESENQLIKIIKNFASKKIKLKVLANLILSQISEIYFKNILNNNTSLLKIQKLERLTNTPDASEIVVSSGSTMSIESLGRKTRQLLFIHCQKTLQKKFLGIFY